MKSVKAIVMVIAGVCTLCAGLMVTGCGTTARARKVKTSGFMNDYSILKRTKGDKAQLLYVNYKTDWKQYDKIYVEPITIWQTKGSPLADVDPDEVKNLASFFHAALVKELEKDYTIVNRAGPNTLRIRLALTEAEKSNVPLDIVSTVVPVGLGVSFAKDLATGTHAFVGKMAAEMEMRDAQTDELIAAAVAARVGEKLVFNTEQISKWGDVNDASLEWAKRLRVRLAQARAGTLQQELAD